jgi:hypothetical protein
VALNQIINLLPARRHIDCLINIPDKKVTSLDDLADEAFELLGEIGKRGKSTAFPSKLVEKAF